MSNLKHVNESLHFYLKNEHYKSLINYVLQDNVPIKVKYNLVSLLMNHSAEKIIINNLRDRLCEFYCSDKDIETYLDSIIDFNPKLGYVEITSKSKHDMKDDYNVGIKIPIKYNENVEEYFKIADDKIKNIKEVLRMILMESKFVDD